MAYLTTPKLIFPLEYYAVNGAPFGKRMVYDGVFMGSAPGRRLCIAGRDGCTGLRTRQSSVCSIASRNGRKRQLGAYYHHSAQASAHPYGFLFCLRAFGTSFKRIGDQVELGEPIGFIGERFTAENGFWESHLHFAIYVGPWKNDVLPGYWKEGENRTRPEWWQNPSEFVRGYKNL